MFPIAIAKCGAYRPRNDVGQPLERLLSTGNVVDAQSRTENPTSPQRSYQAHVVLILHGPARIQHHLRNATVLKLPQQTGQALTPSSLLPLAVQSSTDDNKMESIEIGDGRDRLPAISWLLVSPMKGPASAHQASHYRAQPLRIYLVKRGSCHHIYT